MLEEFKFFQALPANEQFLLTRFLLKPSHLKIAQNEQWFSNDIYCHLKKSSNYNYRDGNQS